MNEVLGSKKKKNPAGTHLGERSRKKKQKSMEQIQSVIV